METFVLAAALSFVLYELLAYTHWPTAPGSYSVGTISITFQQATETWARRILRGLLVIGVLLIILFVHTWSFASNPIWQNRSNLILGFMFGPMLGIWINSVLHHSGGKELTRGQIVGGIGLIVFFIVGSVGKEAGNLIEGLVRNVSSVKFAGAELQLSSKSSSSATTPSPTIDIVSGRNSAVLSSSGLLRLGHLDEWAIKQDSDYMEAFKVLEVPELAPSDRRQVAESFAKHMQATRNFAKHMVVPPFQCLSKWLQATADVTSVNSHLTLFASVFRQIGGLGKSRREGGPRAVGTAFVGRSLAVAGDILDFAGPEIVMQWCKDLFEEFCPSDPSRPAPGLTEVTKCISERQAAFKPGSHQDDERLSKLVNDYSGYLETFSAEGGAVSRPYFVIAYASIMAQLGRYEAAATILFDWLDTNLKAKREWPKADQWFEMRARSTLATYLEEWVRRDTQRIPTLVLDEHLKNLDALRVTLSSHLAADPYFFNLLHRTEGDQPLVLTQPVANGCHYKPAEPAASDKVAPSMKRLFLYYVATDLAYQKTTLVHPDYGTRFARETTKDLRWLAQLDVSCAEVKLNAEPSRKDDGSGDRHADLLYAQIMETYSRNALRSFAAGSAESVEARERHLREAIQVTEKGLRVLQAAPETRDELQARTFLERLTLREAATTTEALTQNLRTLQSEEKLAMQPR